VGYFVGWERFGQLLALYRRPDGAGLGGQDLENATSGAVTHSYVANLRYGRIENLGLTKLAAISGAMGFPPVLWFGNVEEGRYAPDDALVAALVNGTACETLGEVLRMRLGQRRLLLGIARGISSAPDGAQHRPRRSGLAERRAGRRSALCRSAVRAKTSRIRVRRLASGAAII